MSNIYCLPPEILREVLTYLPIPSLFAFGLTCRYNFHAQATALIRLRVGVFPSRVNAILSLFEANEDRHATQSVQVVLDRKRTRTKDMVIKNQNTKISEIVMKCSRNLRELEVALWALEEPSAGAISRLQNLRHLSIRLDHPHSRHADVAASYWKKSPPSTIWNHFYTCDGQLVFGKLESLKLERAGITNYQLQQIIQQNPRILDIQLRKCLTLTSGWFEWLASADVAKQLTTLHFTHSDNPEIDNRVIPFISAFPALKSLSFLECSNIDDDKVIEINRNRWRLSDFTPAGCNPAAECIEVDPAYK